MCHTKKQQYYTYVHITAKKLITLNFFSHIHIFMKKCCYKYNTYINLSTAI